MGRRGVRAAGLALLLLALTAGQRPTSCNSGGCGSGNGCSANLAPRTVELTPAETADRYTFHFLVGTSTAVTGNAAIPAEFYEGAARGTALTTLDSNSDAYILDGDSSLTRGGLRGPTFFDELGMTAPSWAHLPYTYADNGPAQKVPLQEAWPLPIQTLRVYDVGYCYARIPYQLLADQAEGALQSRLSSCSSSLGRVAVEVGPLLRSAPATTDVPITGTPVQDELVWDVAFDGVLYTGAGSDCSLRYDIGLDTRMIHSFSVVTAKKGTRVELTNFQLLTGKDIGGAGGRPPGFAEGQINNNLRDNFPKNFRDSITSSLTIPTPTGGALNIWKNHMVVTDYNDLNLCHQDSECPTIIGPEDGCFHPTDSESLSGALVAGGVNDDLRKNNYGVCVWRLEPKRVNVHPRGIDIVLIDNPTDTQYMTVSTLAALNSGTLFCTAAPPMPMDPLSPDASGPLVPSRTVKFFPQP